ncbi:MAG: YiiX/YebB-like N1pC/P60 family cysteine hydrolase [Verrucomicrobiales bacterium]
MLNWKSAPQSLSGVSESPQDSASADGAVDSPQPSPASVLVRKAKPSKKRARPEPDELEPAGAIVRRAVRTLCGLGPAMPTPENLSQEMADARNATKRGYFKPDEDERVGAAFSKFLKARAVLEDTILDIEELCSRRDGAFSALSEREQFQAFTACFYAACLLNRTADFVVGRYGRSKVVHHKLDEAEPRFGIPKKCFTQLFRMLTEPSHIWHFQQLIRFAKDNEEKIIGLRDDELVGPLVELLLLERPQLIEFSRRMFYRKRLRYWCYAYVRGQKSSFLQATGAFQQLTGRAISNVRRRGEKRVTPEIQAQIAKLLRPGDIFVTRHDAALSNVLLPGFWPHSAFYIGSQEERARLGVVMDEERARRSADPVSMLESRKDGVRFRRLSTTLGVDAFTVIRPKLDEPQIAEAISRAVTHEGKDYDFSFDFRRADRLVCSELIYRAFHSVGGLEFSLTPAIGRYVITSEELLDRAVDGDGFEVVALFGSNGNGLVTAERAREELIRSYRQERPGVAD